MLQECFDPIADGVSGGDLIPLMVHRYDLFESIFWFANLKYDQFFGLHALHIAVYVVAP